MNKDQLIDDIVLAAIELYSESDITEEQMKADFKYLIDSIDMKPILRTFLQKLEYDDYTNT